MITIERAINGIGLNGNETLLDSSGDPMEFKNIELAIEFLQNNGCDEMTAEEFEDNFTFTEDEI